MKRTKATSDRKAQFSVGLPNRQVDKLTKLAERQGMSRSSYAAAILQDHLAEQKAAAATA